MINAPKVGMPLWYSLLLYLTTPGLAQIDTLKINGVSAPAEDLIQTLLEPGNLDHLPDLETALDLLESLKQNPVNLHEKGQPGLDELFLLTPAQIQSLRTYILSYGHLISLFELQVVPGFDPETIRRISPYIKLDPAFEPMGISLDQMLHNHENQLVVRTGRILETQAGYRQVSTGYRGDPFKYYFRYIRKSSKQFSFGVQGEKDPGEEFFRGSNTGGLDSYSSYLYMHRISRFVDALVLGDYTIGLGQGLVLQNGFGPGKTAWTTSIQRSGSRLKPHTSSNEFNFFRGFAIKSKLTANLEFIHFYSDRKKDASVSVDSTAFSSFQESGYHRTPGEISNEKRVRERIMGQSIQFKWRSGHLALNNLYSHFDRMLLKPDRNYNAFAFSGNQLFLHSLDHHLGYRNLLFFGETAIGHSGALATVQGLQWNLDKQLDLAVLYRYMDKKYPALYSGAFSENTQASNESGFYLGLEFKPESKWKISAYQDFWSHSWYTYNINGPSKGYEQFIRIAYSKKRKLDTYIQFKRRVRQENKNTGLPSEGLNSTALTHWRAQLNYRWNTGWQLRSRIEYAVSRRSKPPALDGLLTYQDVLFQPLQSAFSFSARLAYFNTDDYETRVYAYENDILYNYSVPAFSDQGIRFYVNLRCDLGRQLTAEGRCACTRWFDSSTVGSGLDEIQGNRRTEFKIQLRWQF